VTPALANVVGFVGMGCIIFAYAYATAKAAPDPFVQHGVNLAGAALLTVSLLVNMNVPSLVLEAFWAAIAIWGLVKAFRARQRSPLPHAGGAGDGPPTAITGSSPDLRTPNPSRMREGNQ
jgi:hypothetical protein